MTNCINILHILSSADSNEEDTDNITDTLYITSIASILILNVFIRFVTK